MPRRTLEELIYEKEAALARAEGADEDWDRAKEANDDTEIAAAKQTMSDELDRYDEHNKLVVEMRADLRKKARVNVEAGRIAAVTPTPNSDGGPPEVRRLFGTLGAVRTAEVLRAKLGRL